MKIGGKIMHICTDSVVLLFAYCLLHSSYEEHLVYIVLFNHYNNPLRSVFLLFYK